MASYNAFKLPKVLDTPCAADDPMLYYADNSGCPPRYICRKCGWELDPPAGWDTLGRYDPLAPFIHIKKFVEFPIPETEHYG